MEKLNKKISSLPTMLYLSPLSFFESSILKNNKLLTKKNSIFNAFNWFDSFFRNLLLPQHKHLSCNTLTDEINLYTNTSTEMELNELSDVEINTPTDGQSLHYTLNGTWINSDNTNQLYTDVIVRSKNAKHTWESQKIELPKDEFGAYDVNCSIEFFISPALGPSTPHKIKITEENDKIYLSFIFTNKIDVITNYKNLDNDYWINIKVRIWKNNPELEIISGVKEDTIWVEASVPGDQLGEYYATTITLNENLTPGTLIGSKIDKDGNIIPGEHDYDRVSVPIPFLGGGTIVLCTYSGGYLFENPRYIGLYTTDNEGNEVSLARFEGRGQFWCEFWCIPNSNSSSQQDTDKLEEILNQATHFRIYNPRKEYDDDHKPDNDHSAITIIQTATNLASRGICEYCYKHGDNKAKWVNNWITGPVGIQNNNFLCLDQIRYGETVEENSKLNEETGETQYDGVYLTSEFIPIKPYHFGNNYYGILSTISASTSICFYNKDKEYLGYYESTDSFDSRKTMVIEKYFNPISADKNFSDTCYIRYSAGIGSTHNYSYNSNALVFKPHEFN